MVMDQPHIAPGEIRAIREGLGLTQVEAGELLGGGPRAFTKYEAGKVRPAAAVVQLLRLLDANPNALDGLRSGGGVIPPREPVVPLLPFEIDGQDIVGFTAQKLHLLLRRLLDVEARANGLPEDGIHVAGNLYAADGGEDGHISWSGGPSSTPFLPSRLNSFQLKAGEISPAKAGREVLAKDGAVKPMVRSVLERDGNYIVLCARSYTRQQIEAREKSIREALRNSGMKIANGQVDFRDANQIASWVNRHPAVAAWVKESTRPGTIGPFRSWDHWARREEHLASPWAEDGRLPALRGLLREGAADPPRIVRVLGPSGVGKSRLVLEALRPPQEAEAFGFSLADLVLHADESEFGASAVNAVVQTLAEHGQRAVVVVDNCPPETHRILAGMVRRDTSRLSLVTVDHEIPRELSEKSDLSPVDVDELETMVRVPEAASSVVEAVVRAACPNLPPGDSQRLVRFSNGFPKVARLVAQAWAVSRPVAYATGKDITEAFVLGHLDSERNEMMRAARVLAAFRLVSLQQEDGDLAKVAEFGGTPSPRALRAMFMRMVGRGVALRRGRYAVLQPPAIAANLAEIQWREEWGSADWDAILGGDTPPGLKVSAAESLALLNTTDIAGQVVRHVCRPGGPFDGRDGLLRPGHAEVLDSLAQIDPVLVGSQIERSLRCIEDLHDIRDDARRELVGTLEKIAFVEESFDLGARLLLRLAHAENQHYGNNATGQFKALFPLLLGNTAADGKTRLELLDDLLGSSDPAQEGIVVEALLAGAKCRDFRRLSGPEFHGARPALEPWHPSTAEEERSYIQGCVRRLSVRAANDGPAAGIARRGLGKRLWPLASIGWVDLVEETVTKVAPHCELWPEALEALWNFLVHDIPKMPKGPDREGRERLIRSLIERLNPQSVNAQLRALVTDMPWNFLRDRPDMNHEELHRRQADVVREFAVKMLERNHVRDLLPRLSRLEPPADGRHPKRMTFEFGKAVAGLSQAPLDWLESIAQALRDQPEDRRDFELLAGCLTGLPCEHAAAVEAFKRRMAEEPGLAPALPLVCSRLGVSASDIALVLPPLRAGLLPPRRLRHWSFGGALEAIDARIVAPLFDALLDHGDEGYRCAIELMGMYALGRLDILEGLRPQLRKVAENLGQLALGPDPFMMMDPAMQSHHFKTLMNWLLENGREDPDARAVAMALSGRLVEQRDDTAFEEDMAQPLLPLLLGEFPEIAWQIIGDAILADDPVEALRLRFLLLGEGLSMEPGDAPILQLPEEVLFAWCRRDGAAAFAASVLPVLGAGAQEGQEAALHPWTARLLDEFGDNEDMLDVLHCNISSFFAWGSPSAHLARYEEPLAKLRDGHRSLRVRRWAKDMLHAFSEQGQTDRAREEEQKARHER